MVPNKFSEDEALFAQEEERYNMEKWVLDCLAIFFVAILGIFGYIANLIFS